MKALFILFIVVAGYSAAAQNPFVWSNEGLTEDERALAYIAMKEPPKDISAGEWLGQKDRLLRRITTKSPPVPNLAQRLIAIAGETDCERVTREYIMQYLQLNLREKVSASEQRAIGDFLKQTAFDVKNKSAGTAMLVMKSDPKASSSDIENAATALLLSDKAEDQNRIVALQLLKETNPALAQDLAARSMASNPLSGFERVLPRVISGNPCKGCEP
ncbi:MAG: hypothetical protein M5U15_03700 [Kiritimatiellae bacterium]|nr:hypothetical protein [Kiritimatiellia bacterium]